MARFLMLLLILISGLQSHYVLVQPCKNYDHRPMKHKRNVIFGGLVMEAKPLSCSYQMKSFMLLYIFIF